MTLVGTPRVIFLDEPTTGLDPRSRRTMWQIIRELVADGVTIFLTTQHLEEADALADRIAVLDHGRIAADGTPADLKAQLPDAGHIQLHFTEPAALHSAAALMPTAESDPHQLTLQVSADGTVETLRGLLNQLHQARIPVGHLSLHTPDLDDVFFAVTGHATVEPTPTAQETPQP